MKVTDIRVGDLVRATRKKDPEEHRQGRAVRVGDSYVTFGSGIRVDRADYDFEVLDRPLPPIDEELVNGAAEAYRSGRSKSFHSISSNGEAIKAVINFLRKNDPILKESSK